MKNIQTLDLRKGSYTNNFQKSVDGLIEAGAVKASGDRPFLRQPTRPSLNVVLRPNAPSISWERMAPTVCIWGLSGPLGMIVSGGITALMVALGAISVQHQELNCEGLGQCIGSAFRNAIGEAVGLVILILAVFLLVVIVAWFLTGMFAGWLAVRHIRRLEPGITNGQAWRVSASWGCGAIVAAVGMIFLIGIVSSVFGL